MERSQPNPEADFMQNRNQAHEVANKVDAILDVYGTPLKPNPTIREMQHRAEEIQYITDMVHADLKYRGIISPAIRRGVADHVDPTLDLERRESERRSETDSLTGLANREALDRALPAAEADETLAVGFVDGNNVGVINKKPGLGHDAGDAVIRLSAECLKSAAQDKAHIRLFRRGGDEFVVLGPRDEVTATIETAEVLFHERLLLDEPLVEKQTPYSTAAIRAENVSLPGVVASTFAEADQILQEHKRARKAQDTTPSD